MSGCDIDTEVLDQIEDDVEAELVEPVGLLRSGCRLSGELADVLGKGMWAANTARRHQLR